MHKIERPKFAGPDQFTNEEYAVAQVIQRNRLQLVLQECMERYLGVVRSSTDLIAEWTNELFRLQRLYPSISKRVVWAEVFDNWNGVDLSQFPIDDPWVQRQAQIVLDLDRRNGHDTEWVSGGAQHAASERNPGKTDSKGNGEQKDRKQRSHRLF